MATHNISNSNNHDNRNTQQQYQVQVYIIAFQCFSVFFLVGMDVGSFFFNFSWKIINACFPVDFNFTFGISTVISDNQE